jgi:hypothetical protein
VILLVGILAPVLQAQQEPEENPHVWDPQVTRVAVFKNGMGFFTREGDVQLRDGWALSGPVPPALFGTLAIYATDEDQTVDIVGSGPGEKVAFDGTDAPDTEEARRRRLQSAVGLKIELRYEHAGAGSASSGTLRNVGPRYAILERNGESIAVPLAEISTLQVLEMPVRAHVRADEGEAPERTRLGMGYLRKGITWIPEYTLRIIDDETAELTLRGTLVNEAEDLVHTDVSFVVGVPHFAHTEYMAPVAVGQVIRTIGAAVAPSQVQTQMMNRAAMVSNAMRSTSHVGQAPVAREGGEVDLNIPQMGGAAGTDYTVYTRKDLTVRRGEKAIVTLFTRQIKYGHIYDWSVPNDIKHYLVLENSTDTAWTTGPCLALSEGHPLSEDLLKYVPRGGTGRFPVTTAINVATERTETEVDRKLKAHEPQRNFYIDLVTLEGELRLRNFEERDIEVVVNLPLPGKPLKASDGGKITVDTSKLKLLERSGKIRWSLTVPAGETRTLTYTYERYVPSR